jgi:hypothetical protein
VTLSAGLGILLVLWLGGLPGLGDSAKPASKVEGASSGQVLKDTTFYVDSIAGNDGDPGTSPERAWRSLSKINQTTFAPGDRILFKSGGTWTGQLWPKGSGSEGHPIVIAKYGGDPRPVIHGDGAAEDALLLKNQEYWEISDLEITNRGVTPGVRRAVHLVADNHGDVHHIYLRNLDIHDVNGSDQHKDNGGINYSCVGGQKPSRFVDLRIENNHIRHVDRSGIFGWSTHWVRSAWYPSLGVVIRGNVLEDIGGDGIVPVATDGAVVEYNVVGHANQRSEGYNVAIWPWSADNTIIQYNEAFGTRGQRDGEGFDSDWNSRHTLIQYNYSHDNEGGFLLICNEGGHPASESVGNVGTVVRYNISQNDHHRGINIAGPVTDSTVYNNTIFVGKGESVDLLLFSDWRGWADQTSFFNNIFYVEGWAQFSYGLSRNPDGAYATKAGFGSSRDNRFDFNAYYGRMNPPADQHASDRDPMFAAPGSARMGRESAAGYRLRPGSPAIDSGSPVGKDAGRDFFGAPVPSCGGVDRGAAEMPTCARITNPGSVHLNAREP